MGATKATVAVTPEAAPPKKIVDTHTKASVRRELFASEPPSALPDEKSQSVHDKWVEENGAKGLIKLRGEGRTVETVRGEMELYALGMKTAAAKAATVEMAPTLAPLLVAPDEKQAALDAWVKENVGEERGGLLKLRGEGRTVATVAAEVALVIAGAKYALTREGRDHEPEEQKAKADGDASAGAVSLS
jgi:hypothetical protein